jgi:uncharacterized Zn-binding protein involved in type VI secretion
MLACAACADVVGSGSSKRVIGTISFYQDAVRITAPESVQRGEPFEVTVSTYGGGCIIEGDTQLVIEGRTATITPYDIDTTARFQACTAELRIHAHIVHLTFATAGAVDVVVVGVRKPEGGLVTVRHTVVIE